MHATSLQSFYEAAASVSGALIGLLFVAVSVARDRPNEAQRGGHQVPAGVALTAFTNTLCVSLFGLIERGHVAIAASACGFAGMLFVGGALISLYRSRDWSLHHSFILGLMSIVFAGEVIAGLSHAANTGSVAFQNTLAMLIVICFMIGIARSWELIGGQQIGVISEICSALRRRPRHPRGSPRWPSQRHAAAATDRASTPDRPQASCTTGSAVVSWTR